MPTILQIANTDRNLSKMARGLKETKLEDVLTGMGPFTIFAPVNLAFSGLQAMPFEDFFKTGNIDKLLDILSSHIIKEKKMIKNFLNGQRLKALNGKELTVVVNNGEVHINGAKILSRDRQGSNGVLHSIDIVNL